MQRLSARRRGKLNLAVIQIQLKSCHLEEMSLFYFTKFDRFAVWDTVIILDDLLLLSDNVCKIVSLQTLMLVFVFKSEKIDIFNLFGSFLIVIWILWNSGCCWSCSCALWDKDRHFDSFSFCRSKNRRLTPADLSHKVKTVLAFWMKTQPESIKKLRMDTRLPLVIGYLDVPFKSNCMFLDRFWTP